jgi:molybdate transport system substrate-binding protein
MKQRLYLITLLLLLVVFSSGCSTNKPKNNEVQALTIAAASDLALAFTEVGSLFEAETGAKLTFSFGSTGQLADQIENGAPFDVFAAANVMFVDNLREKDLIIPDTQTTYAFGRIGLATLPDSMLSIQTLEDLLKPEVVKVAIANPEHAPYGLAAKQALEGAGYWPELEEKMVYGRNISDTLTFIETGNAEAGIIALSLYQEGKVNFHIIEDNLHAPLEQSVAVISRTKEEQLARQFIDFILGSTGRPIMESYGFIVPESN